MINPKTVETDLINHIAKKKNLDFETAKTLMKKEVYAIMWNELVTGEFDAMVYYDCIHRLNMERKFYNHLYYLANYYTLDDNELQDFLFAYKGQWQLADNWTNLIIEKPNNEIH